MDLDQLEALIWSQVRNLASTDPLKRSTSMEVVRVAITRHAEHVAGGIVRARRADLGEVRKPSRRVQDQHTTV